MSQHSIKINCNGKTVPIPQDYDIGLDMMRVANRFAVTVPVLDYELLRILTVDSAIDVLVDDSRVLSGFIDEAPLSASKGSGIVMNVSGRDLMGRVVDESAPLIGFAGMGLLDLAKKVCDPWVKTVTTKNATNRRLIAGAGAKLGKVTKEPPIETGEGTDRRTSPGEPRWGVLQDFLREAGQTAWLYGDGSALCIGQPNYEQAPTFSFFLAGTGSRRQAEANVSDWEMTHSVAERFARYVVLGTSKATEKTYGKALRSHSEALDGPNPDGTGKEFQHPKTMIIVDDDVDNPKQGAHRARMEMARRLHGGWGHQFTVQGHGQFLAGARVATRYGCDLMARFDSDVPLETIPGYPGKLWMVSAVNLRGSKSGQTTRVTLIPKGSVLTP
jgi:prophage tail gpP-like protein